MIRIGRTLAVRAPTVAPTPLAQAPGLSGEPLAAFIRDDAATVKSASR